MAELVVTIDGPAGSGKSTIARLLAERLGFSFLDTGAMYRAVTLAAMEAGVDMSDEDELIAVLERGEFDFASDDGGMRVSVNGVCVTGAIREPAVTANAHYIASSPRVRERLVKMQREFAEKEERIVTEGRDQGTVAFSDADYKFFLSAELKERARRRQEELRNRNVEVSIEELAEAISKRDKSDQSREVGPLAAADDAIVVDTTDMGIEEVLNELLRLMGENG
jgi:cytidylate kinase